MELARVLRELLKRPRLLALGALIAAVAAVLSVYSFNGGKLKASSLQHSAANTQVLVDSHSSALGSDSQSFEPLAARARAWSQPYPSQTPGSRGKTRNTGWSSKTRKGCRRSRTTPRRRPPVKPS